LGKTLGGKYVVHRVLGEGGMGTVFEAHDVTSGRLVAVKVLHSNQAGKRNAIRRFRQEARAASTIGHPNICAVYELGTLEEGSPYLAMERLVGRTLGDRIAKERGLPCSDVVDTLVQVLSALVAAHEKGIVHRDIKPENVFLSETGNGSPPVVKLLDFGVSKMICAPAGEGADEVDLTRIGMVMGTPHYLSPEQARGDRDLDGRVDVYACGVILYEALTGRRPFSAPNYDALLLQILSAKPRPPGELREGLPPALEAIISKAMARERGDRHPSAVELKRELESVRKGVLAGGAGWPGDEESLPVPESRRDEPVPSSVEIPISVSVTDLSLDDSVSVDVPAVSSPARGVSDPEGDPSET
jgi:serine/threonine-protein kinase